MHVSYRGLLAALILAAARAASAQQETPPPSTGSEAPTPSNPQEQAPAAATGSPVASEPVTEGAGKRSASEEIVVTGSRIRRKDLTTPAPVTVISRDQVLASGKVSIGDFLQTMPEQGNATNTAVNNGGDGTVNVALRTLGPNRTLVLVDGKRMVFGAGGNGGTLASAVDLNAIPPSAIERVEILKDGASSLYGSDAIAGVVNIITRKKANGTEVSGYTGTATRGQGTAYDLSLTTGAGGDAGNFIFTGGYFNQNEIFAGDRGWAQNAVGYNFHNFKESIQGSFRVPSGNFGLTDLNGNPCGITGITSTTTVLPAQSDPKVQKCVDILNGNQDPLGQNVYLFAPGAPGAINGFVPYTGGPQSYNFQPVNYLVTPSQRISLFANGDARLGDIGRAYMQASFVNRQSTVQLAPVPFDTSLYNIPIGLAVSKDNIYNPFGFDVGLAARRMLELNGRAWSSDVDTYHVVAGLDGTLPEALGPAQGFFWDLSFNYGRTNTQYISHNTLRTTKIADAIGPSFTDATGPHCGTPGNVINGCVPLNLFGGANTVTQAMLDPLTYQGDNQLAQHLVSLEATTSGELFRLAASRPAGIALGYQFRREFGISLPNPITAAFEDSDNNFVKTEGSFNVHEAFAELSIPLISDVPFAEQLEVIAAGRFSHYSSFGDQGTYKFGARWRPIQDVTFRGTYSTGFRAPSLSELFSGATQSAEPTNGDPCAAPANATVASQCGAAANNGDVNTQLNGIIGGSTKLQPETSKTFTIGAVLEPSMVRNLSVTVDYYHISIDNVVSAYGLDFILNKCTPGTAGTPDPAFCDLITRNANHRVVQVIDTNVNIGSQVTSGIDLALRYALPTDYGRFGLLFDSNILIKNDQDVPAPTGGLRTIHFKSTYDQIGFGQGVGGVNPIFKANAGVTYGLGGFSGAVSGRYIGPMWECAGSNGRSPGFCYQQTPENSLHRLVSQYVVFDLFASYALRTPVGRTTLSAGVNNVLNTNPPRIYDNTFTFSDPTAYDYIGRYVYGRLTQQF